VPLDRRSVRRLPPLLVDVAESLFEMVSRLRVSGPSTDVIVSVAADGWSLDSRNGDWGLPRVADYPGLGLG
jgi:hypothetical protein